MASEKPKTTAKMAPKRKGKPLAPKSAKKTKKAKNNNGKSKDQNPSSKVDAFKVLPASQQRKFFLEQFQSANGVKLSSLELDSIKETYFLDPSEETSEDSSNLSRHLKAAFGSSWKEVLCEGQVVECKIDPGNPAVLVVSASAIRSLELLRALRSFTRECHAIKLFSKHIKIEDQVTQLKNRVNIGSGTPSRIKKLCEMEALVLSRLAVIVLDMSTDVKGYSLLTLPQVRDEFWDLYKSYFHQLLLEGRLRLCLYGAFPMGSESQQKSS